MKYVAMTTSVLGKKWEVRFCTRKHFEKKHEKSDVAATQIDDRQIYFRAGELSKETVIHELVHVYLHELCVNSAGLHVDQVEEVFCEMLSKYGKKLLKQADSIHATYRVLCRKFCA